MAFRWLTKSRSVQVIFLSCFLLGMAASPPLVGGPAPPFNLKTLEGQTIDLSDFKGRFVVLNFWATWCVPCIKEMPEFQKAHKSLSPKVQIIGINLAESREKIGKFVETNRISFPILLDEYGDVSQEYEVLHLPVTYFITPDGIIRDKIFGGGITQQIIEAKIMVNAK